MNSRDSSSPIFEDEELYLNSSTFKSVDDLLKSVRAFYYAKGYGLSISDSKKDEYVALQCDRSGSYRDVRSIGEKRKRSTTSYLIECPFHIVGKKEGDGAWGFKIQNLAHNHEPFTDMSGHPSFRRLPQEDVLTFKSMTLSGIPPRQIISSLRQQNPNLPINSRTIYNLKAKLRKDGLGKRSLVGALFEELQKEDKDSYRWALNAFKKFLGPTNQPVVIMSDRELALMNAIKDVFPSKKSLLCIWHIQKNVFSNCKKAFENAEEFNIFMSRWNIMAYSTAESLFEKNWGEFELG
nr:protein FAR1-related sequence 5 [Tanacetum cinerariifolium]